MISYNAYPEERVPQIVDQYCHNDNRFHAIRHSENIVPFKNFSYLSRDAKTNRFIFPDDDDS
jgi:hypothetical protein